MSQEDHEEQSSLQGLHAVTIMFEVGGPPVVELGDLSPYAAVGLLRAVTDALEATLHPPTISYRGDVIFSVSFDEDE